MVISGYAITCKWLNKEKELAVEWATFGKSYKTHSQNLISELIHTINMEFTEDHIHKHEMVKDSVTGLQIRKNKNMKVHLKNCAVFVS